MNPNLWAEVPGKVSNEQVVQIVNEAIELRGSVGKLKTMLAALFGIAVLLSISKLGTSMAAMRLSKETTVDEEGHMVSVNGHQEVWICHIFMHGYG